MNIEKTIDNAVVLRPLEIGAFIDDATYELEELDARIARAYICFYLHNFAYVPWKYLQTHYGIEEHRSWPKQVKEMVMSATNDDFIIERLKSLGDNFYGLDKNKPLYSVTSSHLEEGLIWKACHFLLVKIDKPRIIMAMECREMSAEEIVEHFHIEEL